MGGSVTRAARQPWVVGVAGVAVFLVAIVGAQLSVAVFGIAAVAFLALLGYAAVHWPRTVLVIVALSAILDRYVVAGLLPSSLGLLAHFFSESLLGVVGAVITVQAWRAHRLRHAFDHPVTVFLAVFVALGLASAVVNRVPPVQALAGIVLTIDAVALFYLGRMIGFTSRQAVAAISGFVGLMLLAAFIAFLQGLLTPELFGLRVLVGRFGEAYRLASIFGDPNIFAALISAAAPFAIVGTVRFGRPRDRWLSGAAAFLLLLAMWLSFSRGGWLGMLVGFVVGALLLDRRALLVGLAVIVLAFGTAVVMPRDIVGGILGERRPDLIGSTFNRFGTIGEGQDLRTLFILNGIPIVADQPLLGVGPGRYGGAAADIFGTPVYAEYGTDALFSDPSQRTVDDFWLHLLVESGVLGFMAFVGMVLTALVPIMRATVLEIGRRRVVLTGIAIATLALVVNSVTTMLLEANSVAFVFWFLLGIGSLVAAHEDTEPAAEGSQVFPPAPVAGALA
jgi:putative inorganic carbon (HCO3(-)) transporter